MTERLIARFGGLLAEQPSGTGFVDNTLNATAGSRMRSRRASGLLNQILPSPSTANPPPLIPYSPSSTTVETEPSGRISWIAVPSAK